MSCLEAEWSNENGFRMFDLSTIQAGKSVFRSKIATEKRSPESTDKPENFVKRKPHLRGTFGRKFSRKSIQFLPAIRLHDNGKPIFLISFRRPSIRRAMPTLQCKARRMVRIEDRNRLGILWKRTTRKESDR